jgi:hypothetical protein
MFEYALEWFNRDLAQWETLTRDQLSFSCKCGGRMRLADGNLWLCADLPRGKAGDLLDLPADGVVIQYWCDKCAEPLVIAEEKFRMMHGLNDGVHYFRYWPKDLAKITVDEELAGLP